jgi:hypothetical protein
VPLKAFCSFTLDPGYCTYGGDNYINMSLSVAGNQGDCLRNMIQNVTEQKMGKMSHPVSLVDGEVTYPDHWHMSPTLVASSTVLADCESEIVLSCPSSAASDAKEAVACLTDPQTVTRPQQACSDALLRKGTISAELEDIWDIAHMMQMYNFKKVRSDKERRTEGWAEGWSEATAKASSNLLPSRFAHRRRNVSPTPLPARLLAPTQTRNTGTSSPLTTNPFSPRPRQSPPRPPSQLLVHLLSFRPSTSTIL